MSEITVATNSVLYPQPGNELHLVDPVAFVLAIVGGPVLVTLATFWLMYIPVAALMLGGPLYLVIGTPVLLWHLGRHEPDVGRIAMLTLVSLVSTTLPAGALALAMGELQWAQIALFLCIFGIIFAPVWGAATGTIYIRLRRDFFVQPTHP